MKKEITVVCPHCQKKFEYFNSASRPFCSERCRLVDLGTWLNEGYNIPITAEEIEDEEQLPEDRKNEDPC